MRKHNSGGFTLVELVIAIAIATVVTAAALSAMMFGFRVSAKTNAHAQQQIEINMLTKIVQIIAETPDIAVTADGKQIVRYETDENGDIVIDDSGNQSIAKVYAKCEGGIIYVNGAEFMENVTAFSAELNEPTQLLTITVTTNGITYTSSAYCRLVPTPTPVPPPSPTEVPNI